MTIDLQPFQPENEETAKNNVSCRITVYDFVVRWTEIIICWFMTQRHRSVAAGSDLWRT